MGLLLIVLGIVMLSLAFVPRVRMFFDVYFIMFWMGCGFAAIFIGFYYLAAQ